MNFYCARYFSELSYMSAFFFNFYFFTNFQNITVFWSISLQFNTAEVHPDTHDTIHL